MIFALNEFNFTIFNKFSLSLWRMRVITLCFCILYSSLRLVCSFWFKLRSLALSYRSLRFSILNKIWLSIYGNLTFLVEVCWKVFELTIRLISVLISSNVFLFNRFKCCLSATIIRGLWNILELDQIELFGDPRT